MNVRELPFLSFCFPFFRLVSLPLSSSPLPSPFFFFSSRNGSLQGNVRSRQIDRLGQFQRSKEGGRILISCEDRKAS